MNKKELVSAIAEKTGLTKTDSEKVLGVTLDAIKESLKKKESVSLVGFGTFSTVDKAAREGINPLTKKPLSIPAKTVAKFKPSKSILD